MCDLIWLFLKVSEYFFEFYEMKLPLRIYQDTGINNGISYENYSDKTTESTDLSMKHEMKT